MKKALMCLAFGPGHTRCTTPLCTILLIAVTLPLVSIRSPYSEVLWRKWNTGGVSRIEKNNRVVEFPVNRILIDNTTHQPQVVQVDNAARGSLHSASSSEDGGFGHDEVSLHFLLGNIFCCGLTGQSLPIVGWNLFIGELRDESRRRYVQSWRVTKIFQLDRSSGIHHDTSFVSLGRIWKNVYGIYVERISGKSDPRPLAAKKRIVVNFVGLDHLVKLIGINPSNPYGNEKDQYLHEKLPIKASMPRRLIGVLIGTAMFGWGRWTTRYSTHLIDKRTFIGGIICTIGGIILAFWSV